MWIQKSTRLKVHTAYFSCYRKYLGKHSLFRNLIASVLGGFRFYSNCDPEQGRPFDELHFQGKTRTKTAEFNQD